MKFTKKISPGIYSIILIVLAWEITARIIALPALFPPLSEITGQLFHLLFSASFYTSLGTTIFRGLTGFILSFGISLALAVLSFYQPFWKEFLRPLVLICRSVPVISIVLIALLWFSPPLLPVFIAFVTMFPILYQSTLNGLEQTDVKLIEMARIYRKNKWNIFSTVLLPSASEIIYGGISTAMGFGWRAIIIGEVLAQPLHGLGTEMKKAQAYIDMQDLMAWTVVAIVVSYFFEYLFRHPSRQKIYFHFNNHVKNTNLRLQSSELKDIKLINLNKSFNDKIICQDLNISINKENIYWLTTPSGSGKTTLLRMISGLDKADSGEIKLDKNFTIGYAFQETRLLPWLNVIDNLLYVVYAPKENQQQVILAEYLMEKLHLTGLENQFPDTLSGGEKQRVELARALMIRPDILLLDEPLNGLDVNLKANIRNFLFHHIKENNILTIWSTHDQPTT